MPINPPPVPDERSALVAYLAHQQDAFRAVSHGLTDDQAATRSTVSALTIGILVKHVTESQELWLASVLAAPEVPVEDDPDAGLVALRWVEGDTLAGVIEAFDEVCVQVLDAVRTVDLDLFVPVPPSPWKPDVEGWSVRWVWFHLVEELARHAGHADIIRESIDGATMLELVAGYEGWEPNEWVTPWGGEPVDPARR